MMYITITGLDHYLGLRPLKVGRIVCLCKEPQNAYDSEAIRVELPYIDTIGYVANSTKTVYDGTFSAGRIYDKIDTRAFAEIMFITHSSAIAAIIPPEEIRKMRENDPESVPEPIVTEEAAEPENGLPGMRFRIGFCTD